MKKPQLIFLSLLNLLAISHAQAGAVSAGGMQMPAAVECLFLDEARPLEPYNFMSFESRNSKTGVLVHVDFRTRKPLASFSSKALKIVKASGKTTYSGALKSEDQSDSPKLRVSIDTSESLSHDDYIAQFSSLTSIKHVTFEKNAVGHHASLAFQGQKLSGICADGPLFYYPASSR